MSEMARPAREMREEKGSSRLALGEMAMGFIRGEVLRAAGCLGIADALAGCVRRLTRTTTRGWCRSTPSG